MSYKPFESILQAIVDGQIQEVTLAHRGLDDSNCAQLGEAIAKSTTVTVLDLQGNTVTSTGVKSLCDGLLTNRTIMELGLSSNAVTDEGARNILTVLNTNHVLRSVNLHGNTIDSALLKEVDFWTALNAQPTVFKEVVPALLAGEVVESLDFSETKGTLSVQLLSSVLAKNQSVRSLNLCCAAIGDMGADIIGQMLKDKKGLDVLNLDHNGISLHGVRNLANSGLKENTSITKLSLRENKIGDDAARLLIAMLRENDTLTELDVADNAISQTVAESLAYSLHLNQQPTELKRARQAVELNDSSVTDIHFAWIKNMTLSAHFLTPVLKNCLHVVNLNISNARVGDSGATDLATVLKTNKSLVIVECANNDITSLGAQAIAASIRNNNTLTELNVANNEIGDDGAAEMASALQVNSTVLVMNIELNPLSDVLVDEIEGMLLINAQPRALKPVIAMVEANSEDAAMLDFSQHDGERFYNDNSALVLSRALKNNTMVKEVDLANNNIGDAGGCSLAEMIKVNTSVSVLSVAENSIGDRGGKAIVEALLDNNSILTLNLKGNCCGEATAEDMLHMLTQNHFINDVNMEGCRVSKSTLNEIRIACAINLQPTSLKLMLNQLRSKDPELHSLLLQVDTEEMHKTRVYDDTAIKLLCHEMTDNEHIVVLDLTDNHISANGCQTLGDWLSHPGTKLQELRLMGNKLSDEGVITLAKAFAKSTTLKVIDLRNTGLKDAGLLALAECLTDNDSIKYIQITKEGVGATAIAKLTRELAINRQPKALKKALPPIVANDPNVTSVDLHRSEELVLDDLSCQLLAHALTGNTHITAMDLSGNEITTDGVEYLADMLEDSKAIAEVHLDDNKIDDIGTQMLIKALNANYSIRYVGLNGNPISESVAREVEYLMRVNNSPYGLKQVTMALASNDPSVTVLNFAGENGAKFSDDAVRIMCSLLVENTQVTHVGLANNCVTDIGASFIADLLRVNQTITHIDLFGNEVSEEGADGLYQSLKANHTLVSLGLGHNPIPPKSDIFEYLTGVLTVNATPMVVPRKKKGQFNKRFDVDQCDDKIMFKDTEYLHDVEDQIWTDAQTDCPRHFQAKGGVKLLEE